MSTDDTRKQKNNSQKKKSKAILWMQLMACRAVYVGFGALVVMFAIHQHQNRRSGSGGSDDDNKNVMMGRKGPITTERKLRGKKVFSV